MTKSYLKLLPAALLGAVLSFAPQGAGAQSVQVGVLECTVAPGVGVVIGSSKDAACVFHPARGRPEYYAGRISHVGVDIGITGPAKLSWNVILGALPPHHAHWLLAGNYGGASIGLAVGPGGAADSLVGGANNAVNLVPLSGSTEGLGLFAGIGQLSLQPASMPPRFSRRPS